MSLVPVEAIGTSNFDLDMLLVKERYLTFQRCLHPDLLSFHLKNNADSAEEQRSKLEEWSTWINRAWETIRDPLKRAMHLIGMEEAELEKAQTDSNTLMTAMQVREELEMDGRDVHRLKVENTERIGEVEEALKGAFQCKHDRKDIIELITKLKYWYSLRDAIREHAMNALFAT